MENKNKFYVGQEVVCLITHPDSLENGVVKGNAYIVKAIDECKCGLTIDIGVPAYKILDEDKEVEIECSNCLSVTHDNVWWFLAKRFVPVDYTTAKQVTFKEIVESVPSFTN